MSIVTERNVHYECVSFHSPCAIQVSHSIVFAHPEVQLGVDKVWWPMEVPGKLMSVKLETVVLAHLAVRSLSGNKNTSINFSTAIRLRQDLNIS